MKDSLDTPMSGHCWKLDEGVLENSQTVSVCYVGLQVHESDGFGTAKTMCGPRSTVNIKDDGFMLILVKRCGTTQEPTLKVCFYLTYFGQYITNTTSQVGIARYPIASPSQMMAQQTSLDVMFETRIISAHEHDVQRKSFSGSCKRFENYDERIWTSPSSTNSDETTIERSESFKPT
jgi:hypothetical protein